MVGKLALGSESSRQTQNPERGRKLVIASRRAWRADCRQTQNPERGRKPDGTELSGFYQVVVRPKTPRGDGNSRRGMARQAWLGGRQTQNPERGRKLDTDMTAVPHLTQSSDPKPREGTETPHRFP
ncbi:hypothetical protein AP13_04071 [Mycobacterium tuberculosis M2142]|nr:hypothetical protein AP13_04071 [Mycobacterium tuberculosis M2142]